MNHRELKDFATDVLREIGLHHIKKEYKTLAGRVDVVGMNAMLKVAIECGYSSKKRIMEFSKIFDGVIHIPYTLTPETFPYLSKNIAKTFQKWLALQEKKNGEKNRS